jgi:hypothetical protein
MRYSPYVVEEEFCELRMYGILRSSLLTNNTKDVPCGGCAAARLYL